MNLARDVYDLVRAAELDPASLEAAINAIPRQAAESMAFNWHWSGPRPRGRRGKEPARRPARRTRRCTDPGAPRRDGRKAGAVRRAADKDRGPDGHRRDDHGGRTTAPSGDGTSGRRRPVRGARNQRTSEDEGPGSRHHTRVCQATLPSAQRRLPDLSREGRQGHALANGCESDESAAPARREAGCYADLSPARRRTDPCSPATGGRPRPVPCLFQADRSPARASAAQRLKPTLGPITGLRLTCGLT